MAIGENAAIEVVGTADEVISISGSSVADAAFSDSGDQTEWTNDDDAPYAMFVLDATMGSSPDAGSSINLYARLMNISDTTEDAPTPSSTYRHYFLGAFPMDSGQTGQITAIRAKLPNTKSSQVYQFFLENYSGQNLNTGSTVDVIPITFAPHPA